MAGSDVENMGKAAVFLLQSNDLVPMNRLPVPVGPRMSMTRTPSTYTSWKNGVRTRVSKRLRYSLSPLVPYRLFFFR
jgi:hypothetical protein